MKDLLRANYNLDVESIIKVSPKTYRIQANDQPFLLKNNQNPDVENIIKRLEMLNIDTFVIPIKNVDDEYIISYEDEYYALYPYFEDDNTLNKDIRIRFYIKSLAFLHTQSSFKINGTDGYFSETLDYLEDRIKDVNELLLARIRRVERESYHSPSDWFFLVNYEKFNNAIKESKKHLKNLEDTLSESEGNLCLTYRNFDYSHIIVKRQKIVSIDKMSIAPSIYDLFFLFDESISNKLDSSYYLKEYLQVHPLNKYEIEELLTFLFIPKVKRMKDESSDIDILLKALNYLNQVEKASQILIDE